MNAPITDYYGASHPASNRVPYYDRVRVQADPNRSVRGALISAGIIRDRSEDTTDEVTRLRLAGRPVLRLDDVAKRVAAHTIAAPSVSGGVAVVQGEIRSNLSFAQLPWLSNACAEGIE